MNNEQELKAVFEQYCSLLDKIKRIDDGTKEALAQYLGSLGFFNSPLTSENLYAFEGGMPSFCVDLYHTMAKLNKALELNFDDDSILILSLFCTVGKLNYYEKQSKNIKVYDENGTNHDELGRFYWKSVQSYGIRKANEREVFGSLGLNSYMILSRFIPLSEDEIAVLINFNCGYVRDDIKDSNEFNARFPLFIFLQSVSRMLLYMPIIKDVDLTKEEKPIIQEIGESDLPY